MSEKNTVNDSPAIELKIELAHLGDCDVARKVFSSLAKAFSAVSSEKSPNCDWVKTFDIALKQNLHDSLDPEETSLITASYQCRSNNYFISDKDYEDYLLWDSIAGLDDGFSSSPRHPRRGSYDDDDDWLSADD